MEELLLAAEYVLNAGNQNVILCERGIRTFETHTRYTLPLATVPYLHERTHLPVIVDPSHGTGHANLVPRMAAAAVAVGADGLMIEVHPDAGNGPQRRLPNARLRGVRRDDGPLPQSGRSRGEDHGAAVARKRGRRGEGEGEGRRETSRHTGVAGLASPWTAPS